MSSKATPKAAAAPAKKAAAPAAAPAATPKPASKPAAAAAPATKPAGKAAPAATPKPQGKEAPKQAAAAAPAKAAGAKKEVSTGSNAVIVYGYHFAGKAYSEIRSSFEEHFGALVQFRIKRSPRTKKGPYAIAFFENAASAKKALEVNGKNFDGSVVKVEVANKAKLVPESSSRFSTLWISPVNRAVTHQQIYDYVKSATTKPLRVRRYKAGYARVYFDTVEHAQQAAKSASGPIRTGDSKPATIRFSSRTKAHDKKKFVEPLKLATKQRATAAAAKVSPKAGAKPAGAPAKAAPTPKAAATEKPKAEKAEKAAPTPKAAAPEKTPKAAEKKTAESKPAAAPAPTPSSKAAAGAKGAAAKSEAATPAAKAKKAGKQ